MIALRPFALSAFILALVPAAHAHLGDTLAQATQSYGAATVRTAAVPATSSRGFSTGELTIEADFINDTIRRMTYRGTRAFAEEEIQKLLAENAGSYSWLAQSNRLNPMREAIGQRVWLRSDRGSATLTRHTDGKIVTENLVLTDGVWLMANLKLKLDPKPATPAPVPPAAAEIPEHALTWTEYDGVHNPAAAHLVLDGQDLGRGDAGLAALRQHLAALPAKAQVKIIPYYGDPGGAVIEHQPLSLDDLRTYCEAHDLILLIPQSE